MNVAVSAVVLLYCHQKEVIIYIIIYQIFTWTPENTIYKWEVYWLNIIRVRTKLSEELGHSAAADRERVIDGSLDNLPVAST